MVKHAYSPFILYSATQNDDTVDVNQINNCVLKNSTESTQYPGEVEEHFLTF